MSILLRPEFPHAPPVSGSSPLTSDVSMKGPAMSHPDNVVHFALRKIAERPPEPIPVSGANVTDIARIRERIEVVLNMTASIVKENLEQLNENLPVTRQLDVQEYVERIADLKSDMLGNLSADLIED